MSDSPIQPRKKCRTESARTSACGPWAEILPLISPNLIPKSSKDPNRGMYPRKRQKSKNKETDLRCPKFKQASKLYKELSKDSVVVDESGDNAASKAISHEVVQNAKLNFSSISTKKRKSHKSDFLGRDSLSNKIVNYFKPVPCPKFKTKKSETISCISHASSTSNDDKDIDLYNEKFFKKIQNCYGLLGELSKNNNEGNDMPNYFERLPIHIMERIFCQIPFKDLMQYRLVCTTWNEVISDKKFMEWKKLYYGIKLERSQALNFMDAICESMELSVADDCFKVLIRFMGDKFCRKPSSDMCDLLALSTKAVEAKLVIGERFPEFLSKDSLPWCIFAVAILLSETVWDVYNMYKGLFISKSDCSLHDVTDAMYCIATFLLYYRVVYKINAGLHYRVYYTLYLIENSLPEKPVEGSQTLKVVAGLPGQQSIHSYSESSNSKLTYEQMKILNHRLQPKQIIKIIALAGTGKTTTLIHLAELYPQMQFLTIMFNKAVCDNAKKRFPSNVTCKTAHSLAFEIHGRRLRHKLTSKVRPHDLVFLLEHYKGSSMQVHSYAKNVLFTIEKFTASTAAEISNEHVPIAEDSIRQCISCLDRERLLKDAAQIWNRMIDKDDKQCKVVHDVYLKMYQLTKPKLSQYHCIMVDEAQDCNPAMLDIVLNQKIPVILVGDPNQQIYGFRGANNALQDTPATHTYYLTKSFRFGPEIAYIASCCLEFLKQHTSETLVGNSKPSYVNGKSEGQYAVIARSNVQLFNEVIRLCCMKQRRSFEPKEINGAFAGGIKSYGLNQILDIHKLQMKSHNESVTNLGISDKFISKFNSFTDLSNYAKNVEDSDLLAKIELVRRHATSIPEYIDIIEEKCSHPIELANVVFTTAHKAKGLEFDTVCLTNDYNIIVSNDENPRGMSFDEEISVLYVALTRAKRCLLLPDKLMKILLFYQEKFEYPVSSESLTLSQKELRCAHCTDTFVPHTVLILVRRKIVLANGHAIPGGPLCMKCATEPFARPRIHNDILIMYLDPVNDFAHRSMAALAGPLPSDPPIEHNAFDIFHEAILIQI